MIQTIPTTVSWTHGFQSVGDGGIWNLWAPRASRVELILLDGTTRRALPMRALPDGRFDYAAERVSTGQRYLFRLDGGLERPDPASRWQPEGVHGPSSVWRSSEYAWTDERWAGIALEELVVYELHVGAFTPAGELFGRLRPLLHLETLHPLGRCRQL